MQDSRAIKSVELQMIAHRKKNTGNDVASVADGPNQLLESFLPYWTRLTPLRHFGTKTLAQKSAE